MEDKQVQQYQKLVANAELNIGINPDQRAQQNKIAKNLNVPAQAVYDAPEFATLRNAVNTVNSQTQHTPTLREKLSNLDFFSVSHDDVAPLSEAEKQLRKLHGTVEKAPDKPWYKEMYDSFARGWHGGIGALELQASSRDVFGMQKQRAIAAKANNVDYNPALDIAINYKNNQRYIGHFAPGEKLKNEQEEMAQINENGTMWQATKYAVTHPLSVSSTVAESLGRAAPQLAAAGAAAPAGPYAVAAAAGAGSLATEYMSTFEDVINENADKLGGMSDVQKFAYALQNPKIVEQARNKALKRGISVGLFDAATAGVAGRLLAGAKEGVISPSLRAVGEMGIQAGGGALGEATAQLATGEYKPMDIVMEAIAEIPTGVIEARGNYREARIKALEKRTMDAQNQAQTKEAFDQTVQQSKLARRDPETFGEFIADAAQEHGVSGFYVDAKDLHQSGLAESLAAASPSVAEQYQAALQEGGAIHIPMNEYAANVATNPELANKLTEITRIEPDGDTLAEIKDFKDGEALARDVDAQAQKAERDAVVAEESDQVFNNVHEQLTHVGRFNDEVNRQQALLAANTYQVLAQRLGKSVNELWQAYPINIVGESLNGQLLNQALRDHPPENWTHSESMEDAKALWNVPESQHHNSAVFWTHIKGVPIDTVKNSESYSHSLDAYTVRHIKTRHSSENERKHGQVPVTAEDLSRIEDIVSAPDGIRTDFSSEQGRPRIAYVKRFNDGIIFYMEEASKKKRDMRGISMRKYPSTIDANRVLQIATNPNFYGQTEERAYEANTKDNEYYQDEKSNRGSFNPDTHTIALLKNADLSTFSHELAHFFLEMNTDIAAHLQAAESKGKALSTSEAQYLVDMDTVMHWFGLKNLNEWHALNFEEKRDYHEQFARGFESYLFEGKAPNLEMRSVFARVRDWMVSVYKHLKALNVSLSDDVRQVFDRLVATDEQIKQAEENRSLFQLFENPEQAGMSIDDFKNYHDQFKHAGDASKEAFQARALKDMKYLRNARDKRLRELQNEAKTLRAETEREVTPDVMRLPVYQVWQRLTAKMAANNGTTADWAARLDEHSLIDMGIKPEIIEKLRERKMLSKTKGWHPDLLADMIVDENAQPFYDSGEALVRDVAQARPPKEVINDAADNLMLQRHGDLATPQAIQEAADEAVFNKLRLRVLTTEYNTLAKQLGLPSILQKAANEYATNTISKIALKDLKPAMYRRMAAKAAKAADKAMKKGEIETAANEKRNQILQSALAEAATNAKHEASKMQKQWSSWGGRVRSKYAKTHDVGIVEAVKTVVGMYGVASKKGEKAAEYIDKLKTYDPDRFAVVSDLIQRASLDIDSKGRHRTLSDMSFGELRSKTDELKSLMSYARRSQQVMIDGRMHDRQEIVSKLADQLAKHKPNAKDIKLHEALSDNDKRKQNLQTWIYSGRRVESWARSIGQDFLDYIADPIKQASEQYRADSSNYRKQFKQLLEPIQKDFKVKGKIAAPEIGYSFSGMNELLAALLHTGNSSNKRKLLLGRGWGNLAETGELSTARWDTFVNRIISEGRLRKEHFDFVQGVWDLLEAMKPKAQEAHKQVFGYYFDEVTADEFTTPFGNYRGGYMPAVIDPNLVIDQQLRELSQNENESMSFAFPTTSKGFTKSRVEYNRPLLLDMRTIAQHIDKVSLFSNMEVPVRDVQRIIRDLSGDLNKYQKGAIEGMLQPWLSRVATQRVSTPGSADGGFNRIFTIVRNRAGMATMFANVLNAAQQITGFFLANIRVPKKYMLGATADFIQNPKRMTREVAAASLFMSQRMSNEVAAMNDHIVETLVNPNLLQKAQNWTNRNAYFVQTAMANTMEPIIWKGAYQHFLDSGKTEKQAAREADRVIRETQGSMVPEDVSRIETGHPFLRLFTQFWGYFNMWANLLGTEAIQIMHQGGLAKNKMRAAHLFLIGYYIPAVAAEAIAYAFRGGPTDGDDDGYLDDWLKATLIDGPIKNTAAMVPVVGQMSVLGYEKIFGKPYNGGRLASSPAVSLTESAINAVNSIGKDNNKQKIKDISTLLTLSLGIPATALARPVGYWADVQSGNVEPTSSADAIRGTITGIASPESK